MCHVSTGSMHTNVLLSLSVWIKQLHWVSSLEQRDEPLVLHKGLGGGGGGRGGIASGAERRARKKSFVVGWGGGGGGVEQGRNCFRSRKESKKEVFCCCPHQQLSPLCLEKAAAFLHCVLTSAPLCAGRDLGLRGGGSAVSTWSSHPPGPRADQMLPTSWLWAKWVVFTSFPLCLNDTPI